MRVIIEADSQEEFDSKRADLIKAIAGGKIGVSLKKKMRTRYDAEKPTMTVRTPRYKSQAEVLNHFSEVARRELEELKREIGEIIG